MKYYTIFNPNAGNGTAKDEVSKLNDILSDDTIELVDMTAIKNYQEFFTSMDDGSSIIICGGDGTLNRFVNYAGALPTCDILYYACGTGNDFLADIGGKKGEAPIKINQYLVDLPTVTVKGKDYKFINGIGYGIDGYCCEVGDKMKADGVKDIDYTGIAIKGLLFHYKPTNATVVIDGKEYTYKKAWLVPTMNGRMYGGGMIAAPKQDRLGDGSLSVMTYHGCGKIKALMAFPSIFKGEHVNKTKIVDIKVGREISVKFDRAVALQIDGETILDVTEYSVKAGK